MSEFLQFKAASGHVFYLDNLIAFVCITSCLGYMGVMWGKKQNDKLLHCSISAGLTILLTLIFSKLGWLWFIAPAIVLAIGFGKEVIDRFNKKKLLFDWMDIVADTIGVASVAITYLVLT